MHYPRGLHTFIKSVEIGNGMASGLAQSKKISPKISILSSISLGEITHGGQSLQWTSRTPIDSGNIFVFNVGVGSQGLRRGGVEL